MRNLDHTVDVIVGAVVNRTLKHGSTDERGLVGNLVAEACGYEYRDDFYMDGEFLESPYWRMVFRVRDGRLISDVSNYNGKAREQIDATGYTWQELALMECAFEDNCRGNIYNGILAVFRVLADIHGREPVLDDDMMALIKKGFLNN